MSPVRVAWLAQQMENGCGVSPCTLESQIILWLNCGVLERLWFKHGPMAITEFVSKQIPFLLTNAWKLMRTILWNFLIWFWIANGSSAGIGRCALSIYGERPIVVQTYWQRGVLLNWKREVLYDTCPTFLLQCIYWDSMGFVSSQSCRG